MQQCETNHVTWLPGSRARQATFRDMLKQFRRTAGMTQEELAQAAHVSARTISALERGVNQAPHRDTLELLMDALHLDSEERTLFELMARRVRRLSGCCVDRRLDAPTPGADPPPLVTGNCVLIRLRTCGDEMGLTLSVLEDGSQQEECSAMVEPASNETSREVSFHLTISANRSIQIQTADFSQHRDTTD